MMNTNLSTKAGEVMMYSTWNTLAKYQHRVGR